MGPNHRPFQRRPSRLQRLGNGTPPRRRTSPLPRCHIHHQTNPGGPSQRHRGRRHRRQRQPHAHGLQPHAPFRLHRQLGGRFGQSPSHGECLSGTRCRRSERWTRLDLQTRGAKGEGDEQPHGGDQEEGGERRHRRRGRLRVVLGARRRRPGVRRGRVGHHRRQDGVGRPRAGVRPDGPVAQGGEAAGVDDGDGGAVGESQEDVDECVGEGGCDDYAFGAVAGGD
mmetsp:Transcript_16192/g.24583  ORF Transcript_16192/g.24583 Transcript_16192/m.24583 type:complete len:225 (-) Transcript_16192:241-915(-)